MVKITAFVLFAALFVAVFAEENVADIEKIKELLHKTRAEESAKWAAANLIDTIKVPGEYTLEKYTLVKTGSDADHNNLYSLNLSIKITGADNTVTNKVCDVEISDNPLSNVRLFKSPAVCK